MVTLTQVQDMLREKGFSSNLYWTVVLPNEDLGGEFLLDGYYDKSILAPYISNNVLVLPMTLVFIDADTARTAQVTINAAGQMNYWNVEDVLKRIIDEEGSD